MNTNLTEPTGNLPVVESVPFIAHDWCGLNDHYGRFTHVPSGKTLVCEGWMLQADWDKAQLEWFAQFDGDIVVHRCPQGSYCETGDIMGSGSEITERLRARLSLG